MRYFDTSVLVASVVHEPGTARAQALLLDTPAGGLATSGWGLAEGMSALSIKRRNRQLSEADHAGASRLLRALIGDRSLQLPVERAHFERAADLCGMPERNLRAADALHLAIAETAGAALVTFDRPMRDAARAIGIDVIEVD